MKRVYPADDLLSGIIDLSSPVFLDTTSWSAFEDWARKNLKALQVTLRQGLTIYIFADELSHTEPGLYRLYLKDQEIEEDEDSIKLVEDNGEIEAIVTFESRLERNLGVKIHSEKLPAENTPYRTFLYEIQEIYFHDVANRERCDRHAEFIFLARRAARNENILRVLSAQPAFQRLVNAEVFLIPAIIYKPSLPANFDVFMDLHIHPRLRQVVEIDFRNGDYSKVVFQAVNAFRDFIQEITSLTSDGGTLMHEALNFNYSGRGNNKYVTSLPLVKLSKFALNDPASKSEVGEQEGFYRFAQGVFKAIRNPSAHTTWTDPFIKSRYHDENTAIKILCFLSLICERIDNRIT